MVWQDWFWPAIRSSYEREAGFHAYQKDNAWKQWRILPGVFQTFPASDAQRLKTREKAYAPQEKTGI